MPCLTPWHSLTIQTPTHRQDRQQRTDSLPLGLVVPLSLSAWECRQGPGAMLASPSQVELCVCAPPAGLAVLEPRCQEGVCCIPRHGAGQVEGEPASAVRLPAACLPARAPACLSTSPSACLLSSAFLFFANCCLQPNGPWPHVVCPPVASTRTWSWPGPPGRPWLPFPVCAACTAWYCRTS